MNFRKYSKCRRKLRIYIRIIKNTFHYVFHILVLYTKLPIYAYLNSLICSAAFFESRLMTAVYTENTILGLYSTRVSSIVIDCGQMPQLFTRVTLRSLNFRTWLTITRDNKCRDWTDNLIYILRNAFSLTLFPSWETIGNTCATHKISKQSDAHYLTMRV